jgi:hypothetical protein
MSNDVTHEEIVNSSVTPEGDVLKNKRVGRPKKSTLAAVQKKNKVGRPKGDAAIMNDMKARLIASPKSRKVLDSILNAALDDEHKGQQAAWKLLMDRMLPISMFEKGGGSSRPSVNITISGVGTPDISTNTIEADYESVDDEQ